MADFKTQPIEEITPGLTYVTPEAMPAKFNNMTSAIQLADQAVKTAVAVDQRLTMNEAEKTAEDLRQQYQSTSPTAIAELEGQKTRLETSIAEEGPAPYKEELDTIVNKLQLAKEQKVMSPQEFQYRANMSAEELISRNPAYANEITAEFSNVFKRGGLNSYLKQDMAVQANALAAQQAEFKEMTDFLDKQYISWRQDPESVPLLYQQEKQVLRQQIVKQRMVESNEALDEQQKVEFLNNIGGTNGLYREAGKSWTLLFNQLEHIEDNVMDVDQQNDLRQQLIASAKRELQWTVSNLPARNDYEKKRNQDFYSMQLEAINKLDEEMIKVVPANKKEFLTNKRDEILLEQELHEITNNGYNKAKATNLKLTLDTYAVLVTGGDGKLLSLYQQSNPDEMAKVAEAIRDIVSQKGNKIDYNSDNGQYYGEKQSANNYNSYRSFSDLASAELAYGELNPATKGYFNNLFNLTNNLSGDNKVRELDKLLPRISKTNPELISALMLQPDFNKDILSNIEFYKDSAISTIPEGSEVVVQNGKVYAPYDTRLNNNLTRVNEYVRIRALLENKKPEAIIDEVLKTDFPMLTKTNAETEELETIDYNSLG
jgi:hypothetical protein